MAFWGAEIRQNETYTIQPSINDSPRRFRLTRATVVKNDISSISMSNMMYCQIGDKKPIVICALSAVGDCSTMLDFEFEETEEIKFFVKGSTDMHLAGYYIKENVAMTPFLSSADGVPILIENAEFGVDCNKNFTQSEDKAKSAHDFANPSGVELDEMNMVDTGNLQNDESEDCAEGKTKDIDPGGSVEMIHEKETAPIEETQNIEMVGNIDQIDKKAGDNAEGARRVDETNPEPLPKDGTFAESSDCGLVSSKDSNNEQTLFEAKVLVAESKSIGVSFDLPKDSGEKDCNTCEDNFEQFEDVPDSEDETEARPSYFHGGPLISGFLRGRPMKALVSPSANQEKVSTEKKTLNNREEAYVQLASVEERMKRKRTNKTVKSQSGLASSVDVSDAIDEPINKVEVMTGVSVEKPRLKKSRIEKESKEDEEIVQKSHEKETETDYSVEEYVHTVDSAQQIISKDTGDSAQQVISKDTEDSAQQITSKDTEDSADKPIKFLEKLEITIDETHLAIPTKEQEISSEELNPSSYEKKDGGDETENLDKVSSKNQSTRKKLFADGDVSLASEADLTKAAPSLDTNKGSTSFRRSTLEAKKEFGHYLSPVKTVVKLSSKRIRAERNNSQQEKSLLGSSVSIFECLSSESSEVSDTCTQASSEYSSSSSDSEKEGADSVSGEDIERNKKELKSPNTNTQRIDMGTILRQSRIFKQAKLSAVICPLEGIESQPVHISPES